MKYIFRIRTAVIIMLLLSVSPVFSTEKNENVKQAVNVLKGLDNSQTKIWAINVLRQAAETDSSAYAMNALGIAYMKGMGLEQDDSLAALWFERAGQNGYIDAFHNLGSFYKNRPQQDFVRAALSFQKGAEAGSIMSLYDYGFMLYKGLGCNQDYAQAVSLFRRGADYDHSPCLYMLGLCYRNGYGVEQDTDKALYYLKRAAMLSYRFAMEELNREKPENSWEHIYTDDDQITEIPATMPDIQPLITDNSALTGNYRGVLITYDWSGQNIINERPLTLIINAEGKELTGLWHEDNDTVCVKASLSDDGHLLFNKSSIKHHERYVEEGPVRYKFESADICANGNLITGRMRLYSMKEREPERPMYISLYKDNLQEDADNAVTQEKSRIYANPNPFSDHVTIHFELTEDARQAQAHIYSQSGMNVQSFALGSLKAGKQSISLSPAIRDGVYVLSVSAGVQQFRTIIVKKRGTL